MIVVVGGVMPDEDVVALKQLGVREILLQDTPPEEIVETLTQLVAERGPRWSDGRWTWNPGSFPPRYDDAYSARAQPLLVPGARDDAGGGSRGARSCAPAGGLPLRLREARSTGANGTRPASIPTICARSRISRTRFRSITKRDLRALAGARAALRRLSLRARRRDLPHPRHERHDRPADRLRDRPRRLDAIANAHARIMWGMGIRPERHDLRRRHLQPLHGQLGRARRRRAARRQGFPFGAGAPGMTCALRAVAERVKPAAFYGTPTYALHLAETARRKGSTRASSACSVMFFSGEPGASIPGVRDRIEEPSARRCSIAARWPR